MDDTENDDRHLPTNYDDGDIEVNFIRPTERGTQPAFYQVKQSTFGSLSSSPQEEVEDEEDENLKEAIRQSLLPAPNRRRMECEVNKSDTGTGGTSKEVYISHRDDYGIKLSDGTTLNENDAFKYVRNPTNTPYIIRKKEGILVMSDTTHEMDWTIEQGVYIGGSAYIIQQTQNEGHTWIQWSDGMWELER